MLYYQEFINELQTNKSKNTVKIYTRSIQRYNKWFQDQYCGKIDISEISNEHLNLYKNYLSQIKGYNTSGINQHLCGINSYLRFLHKKNIISNGIKASKSTRNVNDYIYAEKPLTEEEKNQFLQCIIETHNIRDIAMIQIILNTGIRVAELLSLEINSAKEIDGYTIIEIYDCYQKKLKPIPLNKAARESLFKYLEYRKSCSASHSKLWIGQRGTITKDGFNKLVKRYADKCGLKNRVNPKQLRNYFIGKLMSRKLVNIKELNIIMNSWKVPNNLYSETNISELANLLENLYTSA